MNAKCVTLTWLSKVDLSNINSGEGGGGNIVELKTYRAGKRPYASGQSVRHALREALERGNPDCFKSTPEAPSCDIKNDWLCDLFGYLSPRKGEGSNRRWSPIKCTPALGQLDSEIVTDLLLRMSDLEKDPGKAALDQRLAYVQLTDNIFRTGLVLDIFAIGRRLVVEGNKDKKEITRREYVSEFDDAERLKRVRAVLMALGQMSDFAKQARNAVSFAPDIFFAAVLPNYTQRGLRVLELDPASGAVDVETLKVVASDLNELGAQLFVGHTPNVVSNDAELLAACSELNISVGKPMETLRRVAEAVA
jgi:CRISPR-associated protein Cst2